MTNHKNKFKKPKMYTPWGELAEINQREYDGKFQLSAYMISPEVQDLWWDYKKACGEVPEWLNQGRWIVTNVFNTLEEALEEVEYR